MNAYSTTVKELYDIQGKEIQHISYRTKAESKATIPIEVKQKGIYFVKLEGYRNKIHLAEKVLVPAL